MKPVYLYGFMGSGKSYTGRKAASETGLCFVDLDEYITKREGINIPEIFKTRGEKFFRSVELKALQEVESDIISLGGGALTNPETALYAKEHAIVIFLNTPFDICFERIKNDGDDKRPNAAGKSKEELFTLYKVREEHYKKTADYILTDEREIIDLIGRKKHDYL
ncbi:MAG: shikimate kinase [Oscillospiraceae bacterium]|nr:shikimate kinase [Oscillospiraceae bacterium]